MTSLQDRPPPKESVFNRLYTGTGAFDVVGHRKRWYAIFGVLVLICLLSMGLRGFNMGIDFEGGTRFQLPAQGANGDISRDDVTDVYKDVVGSEPESVQSVGSGGSKTILLKAEELDQQTIAEVREGLFTELQPLNDEDRPSEASISDSAVSGTWGDEITKKAIIALVVFLVLVTVFLAVYFEFRMAVAALIALLHDVVVTAGIYSLIGFEVTPATVIGLLTILGFSLYDTVVVFDKVQENTRGLLGLTRRTYSEASNLALNQTLMRSINTSVIAVLPVIGLLVVGVGLLGAGTLEDLALVQLVGILAGALSSIFLATPILVDLTMRREEYQTQARKVMQRRAGLARKAAAGDAAAAVEADPTAPDPTAVDDEDAETPTPRRRAPQGVPDRVGKSAADRPQRGGKGRPSGKSGRPTGKRRR